MQVSIPTIGIKTFFECYSEIRVRTIDVALSANLNDCVVHENDAHKYSKGLGFFLISHSSILQEIETHTISKTREHWVLIVRETYGKTQTFQSYGFLTYFMWGINRFISPHMEKVNSHSKEKIREKTSILNLRVS